MSPRQIGEKRCIVIVLEIVVWCAAVSLVWVILCVFYVLAWGEDQQPCRQ